MSYYITASFPKEANLEKLINNINIKTQLRLNELYFRATKSHCDCGTVLGSQNRS